MCARTGPRSPAVARATSRVPDDASPGASVDELVVQCQVPGRGGLNRTRHVLLPS